MCVGEKERETMTERLVAFGAGRRGGDEQQKNKMEKKQVI